MQITLVSITVDDQEKAHRFYTAILGFETSADVPMGPHRWLTVSSPDGVHGVELVLEPLGFEPARVYQQALFDAGIPATAFISSWGHYPLPCSFINTWPVGRPFPTKWTL